MAQVIKTTFQLRRGTAGKWASNNPILARGEPGFEIDTNRLKIGDGVTDWNNLEYIGENGYSGVFNVELKEELPSLGDKNLIYKVESEAKLYQWDSDLQDYVALTSGEVFDPSDIKLINGGNANG